MIEWTKALHDKIDKIVDDDDYAVIRKDSKGEGVVVFRSRWKVEHRERKVKADK